MKPRKGISGHKAGHDGDEAVTEGARPGWEPARGDVEASVGPHEFGPGRRAVARASLPVAPPVRDVETVADAAPDRTADPAGWVMWRLMTAGDVIRRSNMPADIRRLSMAKTAWPEWQRDEAGEPLERVRLNPTNADLDLVDDVVRWLMWLEPAVRQIVWARIMNYSFRKMAKVDPARRNRETIRLVFNCAIQDLVDEFAKPRF